MKYFIYCRKSTDNEERQILSIEAQLAELKEFAAKEKLEIL
jgi:site-specific DNA recombinase